MLLCLLYSDQHLIGNKLEMHSTGKAALKCMFRSAAFLCPPVLIESPCHDKEVVAPVTIAVWILIQLPWWHRMGQGQGSTNSSQSVVQAHIV